MHGTLKITSTLPYGLMIRSIGATLLLPVGRKVERQHDKEKGTFFIMPSFLSLTIILATKSIVFCDLRLV
jgi:hypothetical protein